MFHVSTLLPYTPNNKQQVKTGNPAFPGAPLVVYQEVENRFVWEQMYNRKPRRKGVSLQGMHDMTCVRFDSRPTFITNNLLLFQSAFFCYAIQWKVWLLTYCFFLSAAEEAPHRKWHSDHRVSGAWRSSLHPKGHPLSLSARLHRCTGAWSLLWQHMLQVGFSAENQS